MEANYLPERRPGSLSLPRQPSRATSLFFLGKAETINKMALITATTAEIHRDFAQSSSSLIGAGKETRPGLRRKRRFLWGGPYQAWRDLRSTQWGKAGLWTLYIVWLAVLVYWISLLARIANITSSMDVSACQPDGSFSPIAHAFNWWGSSSFFQISMAGGNLTFKNVKIVDIAVQLVSPRFLSSSHVSNYLRTDWVNGYPDVHGFNFGSSYREKC